MFAGLADRPGAVWLDGGRTGWSVLAWDPVEVVTQGADWPAAGRSLSAGDVLPTEAPFAGGCLGYIGFGAGHRVAPVPAERACPEPEVWLGRYAGGLCYRHRDDTWHPAGTRAFVEAARKRLDRAGFLEPPAPAQPASGARTVDRAHHEAGVQQILEWIAAGDCYQVNLTRPVHLEGVTDPWGVYRRLRADSQASHGAFLRLDADRVVLSNSPELFLEVQGDRVASDPIKGTRPRGDTPAADQALARELADAPKDRAELTMIVDLVRNDLGRVARTGTVRTGPRRIVSHANVHHASQRVEARLEAGSDAWDALAATFPPGSVTGAPKVRACQRIAELEAEPRGVYCGAIGFVDRAGRASWSVAIRTAVVDGTRARYHVGGGVVAASEPGLEWEETVAKGRQLARAFGVSDPG